MTVVRSRGTLDGVQPIEIVGIVDGSGRCIAVRVVCGWDGQPFSWALSDRQIEQFKSIVEALC